MDKEEKAKLLEKCNFVFDIYSKKINSIDAEVEQLERRIKKLKKERAEREYAIALFRDLERSVFGA